MINFKAKINPTEGNKSWILYDNYPFKKIDISYSSSQNI